MLLEETRRSTLIGGGYYPIMFSISKDETVSIKFQMEQSNCQMALIGRKEAIPKVSNHNFLDTIGKHIFFLGTDLGIELFFRRSVHFQRWTI